MNKIYFKTINCDDEEREWNLTPVELEEKYWESEDIPMLDDTVTYCDFGGTEMYFNTFGDLVFAFLGCID